MQQIKEQNTHFECSLYNHKSISDMPLEKIPSRNHQGNTAFLKAKRRGFEFNMSLQQSYGIYKIARGDYYEDDEHSMSCRHLMNYECGTVRDSQGDNPRIFNTIKVEISTTPSLDSSSILGVNKHSTNLAEAKIGSDQEKGVFSEKTGGGVNDEETIFCEGPERRLSHEENQKPDLSDWEWCRSKSERTPRQINNLL